ncbi:cytochrome c oxidase assembly protein COX18, mitochondrial [Erpetoichthys calabaricus]|uniref:Cytochrome c oxidase assembly factor COX18 n=1 Tax=Erpetoichthys calabaricus TaxID=27687 RepID=A0A8C4TM85_ERPCA|nr:cytochrome c oxidase assembly protein COX18, mitochondrial [Erpetoichthys calabaricus]
MVCRCLPRLTCRLATSASCHFRRPGPASLPCGSRLLSDFACSKAPFVTRRWSCYKGRVDHGVRTLSSVPSPGATPGLYERFADSAVVHFTEDVLTSVQQTTGLPWWATVVCTTVTLRTAVTLPLGAYQSLIIAKVEALQPEIAELAKQLHYEVSVRAQQRGWAQKEARFHFKKTLRRIVAELYVRDNCHPFKASLLIWVQLPMWLIVSFALRNLSLGTSDTGAAVHEALGTGGALWFPDLTLPDTTWLMPVSLGLLNLLIIEIFASRKLEPTKFQTWVTHFMRGISLVMIPVAATVPSSMSLYWLTSSAVGLLHNLLLRSPTLRRLCHIPRGHNDSDTPYRDLWGALRARLPR